MITYYHNYYWEKITKNLKFSILVLYLFIKKNSIEMKKSNKMVFLWIIYVIMVYRKVESSMGVDLFIKLMIGIILVGIVIKSIKLIGKIFFRFALISVALLFIYNLLISG